MTVAWRNADDDVLTNASRALATTPLTAVKIDPIDTDAAGGDRNLPVAWRNADDDVLTNAGKDFHFPHGESWRWCLGTAWRAEPGRCVGDWRVRWIAVNRPDGRNVQWWVLSHDGRGGG